ARNAPSASQYIFGPAKWLRHFIMPPPGRVLVHRDYSQQEVRIAAIVSGDRALLRACESGDVYLGIAELLGFLHNSVTDAERGAVRVLFKTVVLGIQLRARCSLVGGARRHFAVRSLRNFGAAARPLSCLRSLRAECARSRWSET